MSMLRIVAVALVLAAGSLLAAERSEACPFCGQVKATLREEIDKVDVAVIARLATNVNAAADPVAGAPPVRAKFMVRTVLKGAKVFGAAKTIETLYFGEAKTGQDFLLLATDAPNFAWAAPIVLSPRAAEYVAKIPSLPTDGTRLKFFNDYLEDADELLAADAYDEFAIAPYSDIVALKPLLKHEKLVTWIKDTKAVVATRRRLYLTLLGVCGTKDDLPMLESMITGSDRMLKSGLDALIACYLTLRGADGVALIEDHFLKNAKSDYADTYAAIMALRFHGSDSDVIPKERVVAAFRTMLDRPALADLVIPDLARWEDWSIMPRLVKLFKDADEKSNWIRVPVIQYLRACPLPEAKKELAVLQKLDPQAFEQANTFFPFSGAATAPPADASKAN